MSGYFCNGLRAASMALAMASGTMAAAAGFEETSGAMPMVAVESYDWEGFFVGATLGGAIFNVEASDLTDTFTNDSPSISMLRPSYGLRLQYNWIPFDNNLVIGPEGDLVFGLLNERVVEFNTAGTDGIAYTYSWDSAMSLRARAAMTNGRILSYVAGGPAWVNAVYTVEDLDPLTPGGCDVNICAEFEETLLGLSFGAGMEYAYRDNIIATFEFMHYEMPMAQANILTAGTTPTCTGADAEECTVFFDQSASVVRVGVSYRF